MIEKVTAETCLAFAIETEERGAELYRGFAQRFPHDPELRELFEGLGQDEVAHGEQLRTLGERLASRLRDRPVTAEDAAYVRAMSMTDVFSRADGPPGGAGEIRTREDALRLALHLEKATLGYYRAVRDLLGADEVLDALIAMERKHVVKVMARLVGAAMLGGLAESA